MADAKRKETSDENLERFCDPCQDDKENVAATCYCEECNAYLCSKCNKVHRRLASTREHVVKDIPEAPSSGTNKTELLEKCVTHGDHVIDHYCVSHEELCCPVCIAKSHQKCENVRNIDEYLKDIDMEQEQRELGVQIRTLADDINITIYLVQISLKAIELNHDLAKSGMLKAKKAAFEYIETIYEALNTQLNETREEDVKKILPYKNKCEALAFDINAVEAYLKDKKKLNSYQSFVAIKKAGIKIKSNRDDLKEIKCKKYLRVKRYSFKPDKTIASLAYQPYSFGTFENQENAIKTTDLVTNLHVREEDEQSGCCITGLAVLSKTCIVLADNNNKTVKLVEVDEDKIISRVKLTSAPWDITVISEQQLAVTVPQTKTVHFLSVTENMTLVMQENQINASGNCYGIASSRDTVFVTLCSPAPKYEQYDFSGKLLHSVILDAENPQYVILNADKTKLLISDNANRKCIQEISVADQRKTDTLNIQEVIGMAVDKTNVLYYCFSNYSSVYAACVDKTLGDYRRTVKLISDYTYYKSLAFCDETNRLFVGIQGDEIRVYYVV